ncbi:hypothetical protein FE257_007091 [Aspergillus nanangensis]|uniref:Uncharacterized protein n=1 Tax=Aspergillus nanangensis TaxID=2582783 RepID=A0AAD4CNP4_ASPNN|nr:hypothetical protein FE257_007091 [Aspergillus nanangensis]
MSVSHKYAHPVLLDAVECRKSSPINPFLSVRPRPLSQPLTRALYIPRHHSGTAHLPLYDVDDRYKDAVKGAIFGTNLYSMQLSQIEKPRGDGLDASVDYLVDMDTIPDLQENYQLRVQRRTLSANHDITVNVLIPSRATGECTLTPSPQNPFDASALRMTASYPLNPSVRGEYLIPHPYFTFRLPGQNNQADRLVRWQVHPAPNNLYRYTLMDLDAAPDGVNDAVSAESPNPSDPRVLAIYDHVGIVVWLPTDFSEGVLLLREGSDQIQEATIVASLLGILWQIRETKEMHPRRERRNSGSSKLLKKMASLVRS